MPTTAPGSPPESALTVTTMAVSRSSQSTCANSMSTLVTVYPPGLRPVVNAWASFLLATKEMVVPLGWARLPTSAGSGGGGTGGASGGASRPLMSILMEGVELVFQAPVEFQVR